MRNNPTLAQSAVDNNLFMFEHIGSDLQDDVEIVEGVLEINGTYLRFVSDDLRADRDMASIAVRQTYKAFGYVDDTLKQDRRAWVSSILEDYSLEVSNYAVRLEEEDWGIQKIPEVFRYHSELCEIGLSNRGKSLEFAPAVIRSDAKLVEIAVRQNGLALEFADPKLQSDTRIVESALKQNGRAVRYVAPLLLEDDKYRNRISRKYSSAESVLREMGYE